MISAHPAGVTRAAQTDLQNVDMNNVAAARPLVVVFMSRRSRDKYKLFRLFINELAL